MSESVIMELRDLGESWFVILVQETVKRERERESNREGQRDIRVAVEYLNLQY